MKLWIIYDIKHENNIASTSMLQRAKENGIDAQLYFFQNFSFVVENNDNQLFYNNNLIKELPDIVLVRGYDYDIQHYLACKKIKFVNDIDGTFKTLDKYEMHIFASQLGIKQPKTILGDNLTYTNICELFNNKTFVMKNRFGMRGENVFLIHNEQEFLNAKLNKNIKYIYQEYIEESKGRDLRLYIVGNKVFGPVERYSTNDDFRSNISLGGSARIFHDLPDNIIKQTLKITQTLGLNFCSVDYLISNNDYIFCEANANASFSIFFDVGIDLQTEIMEYIKNLQL